MIEIPEAVARIVRGVRYSEEYGHHPGTVTLLGLVLVGTFAGGFIGAAVFGLVFGTAYLIGAWERGRSDDRR